MEFIVFTLCTIAIIYKKSLWRQYKEAPEIERLPLIGCFGFLLLFFFFLVLIFCGLIRTFVFKEDIITKRPPPVNQEISGNNQM